MNFCLLLRFPKIISLNKTVYKKGIFAVTSQAIASLANFITSIVAARVLSVEHFGIFVLIFSSLFLMNNIQAALIFKPMMIFGSALEEADLKKHFSACFFYEIIYISFIFLITSFICKVFFKFNFRIYIYLLFFFVFFLLQQYFRFLFFTKSKIGEILFLDTLGYGLRILLLLLFLNFASINLQNIFLILVFPSFLAALWGWILCRKILFLVPSDYIVATFRKFIQISKWMLSYTLTIWLHSNLFFFLVAVLISISAPGILKAAVNLLGPLNIFFIGIFNLALPVTSRYFSKKEYKNFTTLIKHVLVIFIGVTIIYGGVILIKPELFVNILYGANSIYLKYSPLILIFVLQHLLSAINKSHVMGLEAMRETKKIFISYGLAILFSLIFIVPLVKALNVYGAVICWFLCTLITTILTFKFYHSKITILIKK